jgi:putative ABC transport system permease protein
MRTFLSRLLDLALRRRREDRLTEEVQAHLDLLTDENLARGMSLEHARFAARKSFGGVDQLKERYRDQRGLPFLDALTQDLRYSLRMLRKGPALTITAVFALGIGLGANNVTFTMVNGLFFRGLPVPNSQQVVTLVVRDVERARNVGASYPEFEEWKSDVRSISGLVAYRGRSVVIGDAGIAPDQIVVGHLSPGGLATFGVAPQLGRDFRPEEDAVGGPPVAILSDKIWQRRYAGDPAIVGRTVTIAGVATTVIGIMPPGQAFPYSSEAWQPLVQHPEVLAQKRSTRNLTMFGRVIEPQTVVAARAELAAIGEREERQYPDTNKGIRLTVMKFAEANNAGWWQVLPALILAAGLVLLVACANTANLLLARAAGRSREIALRVSLGATRARIVRQLMIESLVLAIAAGIVGSLVSMAGIAFVDYTMRNVGKPYWVQFPMDARVLAFLAGLCLTAPVLFGLLPALHLSKNKGGELLKEGQRSTRGRRIQRWTGGLVVAEIGLSLVVLAFTGILMRTMWSIREADSVIDLEHLLTAGITLPPSYKTADVRFAFVHQLEERLAGNSTMTAASIATLPPLTGVPTRKLVLQDQPLATEAVAPEIGVVSIGSRYFDAIAVSVIRGRAFQDGDGTAGNPVAIVNQRLASQYFPNVDPIGRQIRLIETTVPEKEGPWLTIVGISPSVRQTIVTEANPVVYLPYRGEPPTSLYLVVRSSGPSANVVPVLRDELHALDANIALSTPLTADEMLSVRFSIHNLASGIFMALAIVALLVSTAGLYVITSHAVTSRTQEIGVRMAVGAPARTISWLIGRRALVLIALGCAAGAAGAYWSITLMKVFIAETSASDWRLLVVIAVFLGGITTTAALVPARRAARLDPMSALRHE